MEPQDGSSQRGLAAAGLSYDSEGLSLEDLHVHILDGMKHSPVGLESCDVALLGGLMEHHTSLREEIERIIGLEHKGLRCIDPIHNAAEGAVMTALCMMEA